jgi:hypothetical protein
MGFKWPECEAQIHVVPGILIRGSIRLVPLKQAFALMLWFSVKKCVYFFFFFFFFFFYHLRRLRYSHRPLTNIKNYLTATENNAETQRTKNIDR